MDVETIDVETAAAAFSALGDPVRLRIVEALRGGPRCVCEVRDAVGVGPSLLSYHLKVLRGSGLIEASRRGKWVDYRLSGDGLAALQEFLDAGEGT
jgi:ArsR family transcriptional regulator